jgi:outer membrane biosynthesis protein TonB
MNSPSKHPGDSDSEPDYAPPWARDQIRPIFAHSASLPVEKRTPSELIGGGRAFGDDPAWLRRGLEPDVVPEPPGGLADFWPIVMRLGIVCGVAAIVAGAVVLLFTGKSPIQESVRAKTPPPSIASTSSALPSVQSHGIVPAVLDDKSANAASSAPPQTPPAQPQPQSQPQAAPPAEAPAAAPPPPQVIATAPANPPPASVEPPPAPPVTAPAPAAKPPASEASPPAQAAPNPPPQPAAPAPAPRPAVTLDNDEIVRLIARGKDLLNDGDFAAARLLFERAANAGSADAALALGSTYDPLVIKRLGAVAVTPDLAKAKKWYQFAADHGSAAASVQLANLAHEH